ncbi:MAG: oligosaccharide flippase family protein [Euryarchaeota archaeon]|nr:oligosaccharide flippase family protein [Euryarchaeota archaeon]MCG2736186.1 oligosaccharide flippase family protein [Candidatus Methanoperedenaceae archaeon]
MGMLARKIIRNTFFNIAGGSWGLLIKILLTPFILHYIGTERFGIWALVLLFTGYFALFDMSIGTAVIRYISSYYAKRDFRSINKVLNSALLFYAIAGILSCVVAFFLIKWAVENILHIPSPLLNEANFVLTGGVLIFAFSNTMSVFNSVIIGIQKMDISNKIRIIVTTIEGIGMILFLIGGFGLTGLIINAGIVAVITSLSCVIASKKALPQIAIGSGFIDTRILKELVTFGTKVHFSRIGDMMHFQTDKIFISYFLQISFVAFYDVAATVAFSMRMVPIAIVSAILPAASEIKATGDETSLRELYMRSSKYISLVSIPLLFFVFFLSPDIIKVWLGEGYELSVITLQVLLLGYLSNILTFSGTQVATGLGKPEYVMKSSIIATVLNPVMSILLIAKIGYIGAALGTSMAMAVAAGYFILTVHRTLDIANFVFFKTVLFSPLGACSLALLILYPVVIFIKTSLISLIFEAFLFFALYSLIIFKMKFLDTYDVKLIKEYLPIKI